MRHSEILLSFGVLFQTRSIRRVFGEPARADALTALMTDRALTAPQLAAITGVTKQTMSAHLSKLLDAALYGLSQAHESPPYERPAFATTPLPVNAG